VCSSDLSFINNFIIYVLLAMREEKMLLVFLCLPVSISIVLGPLLIANTWPMGAALSLLLSRATLSIVLITVIQKRLRIFKFAEYKKVACSWLIAAIVFGLFVQVNFFLSSCLALLTYSLLLILGRKSEQEKTGKDTALTNTGK
jgi:O-antigen/teichoic acid export membrane protein